MPEIHFDKDDGPIHLQMNQGYAVVKGDGILKYKITSNLSQTIVPEKPRNPWFNRLDKSLRYLTPLLIILTLVFVGWGWVTGTNAPSFVSMSAKVFSFALTGSFLSLGGVNLLSLKNQLAEKEQSLINVLSQRCPFMVIFEQDSLNKTFVSQKPGNPEFCIRCPLGIDIDRSHPDGLIHMCAVYPDLHRKWKKGLD